MLPFSEEDVTHHLPLHSVHLPILDLILEP